MMQMTMAAAISILILLASYFVLKLDLGKCINHSTRTIHTQEPFDISRRILVSLCLMYFLKTNIVSMTSSVFLVLAPVEL